MSFKYLFLSHPNQKTKKKNIPNFKRLLPRRDYLPASTTIHWYSLVVALCSSCEPIHFRTLVLNIYFRLPLSLYLYTYTRLSTALLVHGHPQCNPFMKYMNR